MWLMCCAGNKCNSVCVGVCVCVCVCVMSVFVCVSVCVCLLFSQRMWSYIEWCVCVRWVYYVCLHVWKCFYVSGRGACICLWLVAFVVMRVLKHVCVCVDL